jgi:hypothetical protein
MAAYNCTEERYQEILRLLAFTEDSYFKRLYNQSQVVNQINGIFTIDIVHQRAGETNADALLRLGEKYPHLNYPQFHQVGNHFNNPEYSLMRLDCWKAIVLEALVRQFPHTEIVNGINVPVEDDRHPIVNVVNNHNPLRRFIDIKQTLKIQEEHMTLDQINKGLDDRLLNLAGQIDVWISYLIFLAYLEIGANRNRIDGKFFILDEEGNPEIIDDEFQRTYDNIGYACQLLEEWIRNCQPQ